MTQILLIWQEQTDCTVGYKAHITICSYFQLFLLPSYELEKPGDVMTVQEHPLDQSKVN